MNISKLAGNISAFTTAVEKNGFYVKCSKSRNFTQEMHLRSIKQQENLCSEVQQHIDKINELKKIAPPAFEHLVPSIEVRTVTKKELEDELGKNHPILKSLEEQTQKKITEIKEIIAAKLGKK